MAGVKRYQGDDRAFRNACIRAMPHAPDQLLTHRQYRKWLKGRGLAYANRSERQKPVEE